MSKNYEKNSLNGGSQICCCFLSIFINFGSILEPPREAKNHQNPKKASKKACPKKGQKKIECWGTPAQGSAEMGDPIKLRFRADQDDFATFFHAFFLVQFLQENAVKKLLKKLCNIMQCEFMPEIKAEQIKIKEIDRVCRM